MKIWKLWGTSSLQCLLSRFGHRYQLQVVRATIAGAKLRETVAIHQLSSKLTAVTRQKLHLRLRGRDVCHPLCGSPLHHIVDCKSRHNLCQWKRLGKAQANQALQFNTVQVGLTVCYSSRHFDPVFRAKFINQNLASQTTNLVIFPYISSLSLIEPYKSLVKSQCSASKKPLKRSMPSHIHTPGMTTSVAPNTKDSNMIKYTTCHNLSNMFPLSGVSIYSPPCPTVVAEFPSMLGNWAPQPVNTVGEWL